MATTEVLRSHDCLRNHFPPHRRLRNPNSNTRFNQNQSSSSPSSARCGRRKRSPYDGNRRSCSLSPPSKGLVMGEVKILKRGEEMKAKTLFGGENVDLGLKMCSTERLGPDAAVVQTQVRVPDLYAGNSTVLSPHPSSLPFPKTLVRKNVAESNLRRMLKI